MSEQYPRTALFGTKERTLFCHTRGREYQLSVALPDGYVTSAQAYPVIYVLDGDFLFGMAAGLTRFSNWFRGVPEAIIVGISYGMESSDEWAQLRERDFKIPEVRDAPPDSAANLFLDALTREMIPFIEANYRTVPSDRCLYGYSSSGFFVLYALFHRPDAFRRYISGSGDLYIAYPYVIQHDARLAARDAAAPIQLYLSAGELEDDQFPYFHQLVAFLERGNYPGLTLTTEIYSGEGHGSEGMALTYLHGLRGVYPQAES
ncbi:MAG TPA: alpha/beta hydrolase-fold protein [Pyrinomonadaceae bacterium]